jgi:hypothetical protein
MTSAIMSAIPIPAVPAPWMTTRWSRIRLPAARTAANASASTTAALHVVVERAHLVGDLLRIRRANVTPKSS